MKVVGLMSGTSADGVDAALVSIVRRGGRPTITPIAFASVPYPRTLQQRVVDLSLHGHVAEICHMNMYLGELFAKAALKVIRAAKYQPADIHVIGSHGQTIHHLPKGRREPGVGLIRSTLQIGEPAVIVGSSGYLEVVANQASAARILGVGVGAPVELSLY